MGKMGSVACIVCGKEFPIEQMEPTFTGRLRYRCRECVAEGNRQARARMSESCAIWYARRLKKNEWK